MMTINESDTINPFQWNFYDLIIAFIAFKVADVSIFYVQSFYVCFCDETNENLLYYRIIKKLCKLSSVFSLLFVVFAQKKI